MEPARTDSLVGNTHSKCVMRISTGEVQGVEIADKKVTQPNLGDQRASWETDV